ncbi:MAG: TIGR01244 family sulfur transferase [Pseudomonadota bacterium]
MSEQPGEHLMQSFQLDENLSVAPQIQPEDVAALKAAGFVGIINNRPDGEMPGQPTDAMIAAAAEAAGLAYAAIPVIGGQLTEAEIAAFGATLAAADGPVLAFCASGTRSSIVWALWASATRPPAELVAAAAEVGYDLRPFVPMLQQRFERSAPAS